MEKVFKIFGKDGVTPEQLSACVYGLTKKSISALDVTEEYNKMKMQKLAIKEEVANGPRNDAPAIPTAPQADATGAGSKVADVSNKPE